MLHLFTALKRRFALDTDSGAVHLLDELSFDALTLLQGGASPAQAEQTLARAYGGQDARDILAEIEALTTQGALFTSHDYSGFAPEAGGPLKAMCLHVAHDCDLRCRYCFAGTGGFHGPRGLMPYETGVAALELLYARSGGREALEVDFFGGEPLLNFDVVQRLVAFARRREQENGKRVSFTLTTNGTHLTQPIIRFLNEEMDNVVLSIDGRREVHDAMRPTAGGLGSYDAVLPLFKQLVEGRGGKSWYVRGTFTRRNLDFASDVLHLHDEGFTQISVEPVVLPAASPLSLHEEHLPDILAQYEILASALLQRRKEGRPATFFHFMIDLENGPCIKKRLSGCGAGHEYIAVTPEGDVFPCHQFVGREGFRLGHVSNGVLDEALIARFAACHVFAKPACASCWARLHCSGGCAANAQAFSGELLTPYPLECAMEKKRLECAIALSACD